MNRVTTTCRLARRSFLGWVSASLPLTLAACNDEPVVFTKPDDAPPGAIDYAELLLQYFGEDGLRDAEVIGNYYAQFNQLSSTEAFEATAHTRAAIDASEDVAHALTDLDALVLEDFLELRLIDVAGWTLSSAEVDLCVLAWLG